MATKGNIRASIFISCLVDQFFPQTGEAMVKVLRRLGVELDFPPDQTCCGQPAFNSGYHREAGSLATQFLEVFEDSEYIVVPSGSCGTMVKMFYPNLLSHKNDDSAQKAKELSSRVYEFSQFVVNVLGVTDVGASFNGKVAYHDSCHLLRELGVYSEPRKLIQGIKGVEMVELKDSNVCCGFGGAFSVKYSEISTAILRDKLRNIETSGADVLVANDAGCLMHIGGGITRQQVPVRTMHLAELLAQEEKSNG